MRIFAVLTLTAGLLLSAAVPALSTTAPEEGTQPPLSETPGSSTDDTDNEEEYDDATPTPAETSTVDAEETETPSPSSTEPADSEEEDSTTGTETESPSPSPTESPEPSPSPSPTETSPTPTDPPATETSTPTPTQSVSCTNATLNLGETITVICSTVPAGLPVYLGSTSSSIGGSIQISGNELTYTAPEELHGTVGDSFTVRVEGEEAITQVTFTVLGTNGPAPSSPTPTYSEPSPTQTQTPPATATPEPPPQTTETSSPPPPPGAPSPPAQQVQEDSIFLPAPGMPELSELLVPWSRDRSAEEPAPAPTASSTPGLHDDDQPGVDGSLAQTGTAASYTAIILALLTTSLGASAIIVSRRFS